MLLPEERSQHIQIRFLVLVLAVAQVVLALAQVAALRVVTP